MPESRGGGSGAARRFRTVASQTCASTVACQSDQMCASARAAAAPTVHLPHDMHCCHAGQQARCHRPGGHQYHEGCKHAGEWQHLLAAVPRHSCPLPSLCGNLLMMCDVLLHSLPVQSSCCLCFLLPVGCCLVLKAFMAPFLCCLDGMSSVPACRCSLLQTATHNTGLPAALTDAPSAVLLTSVTAVCLSRAWRMSAGWHL